MTKPLLSLQNLHISFGHDDRNEVVHGIDLTIQHGEIVGLVGESGSGKTVTGLSILKLLPTDVGHQQADTATLHLSDGNYDLNSIDAKALQTIRGRKIAMIFQEPMSSFNPVMTCGKQVAEVMTTHLNVSKSEAKERCLSLFEKVKLPDPVRAYDAYPHELSGGQLQRVMIAMAISCEPDLIIADEPTTALDVTVQSTIIDLLKALNAELGISILFISHDLGVIANLCDRVVVMRHGDIVEQGSVSDIFDNAQHEYTKGLLACRPTLNTTGKRLPEMQDYLSGINEQQTQVTNRDQHKSELLLEAKAVHKTYKQQSNWWSKAKETKALNDVSLSISTGEIVGLVGESGCGKTTLSNILLGLDKQYEGDVTYRGQSLKTYSRRDWKAFRKEVQVIFQNPYASLNPKMKIGTIIGEPMAVHGIYASRSEQKAAVLDLLDKVGLTAEHYDRYPHQFSGGQRQRIAIARALACKPRLIICDECVSALDVSIQASIINLLLDLRDEFDLAYLFISHDLRVVKFVSDRILVMQQGSIVERGSKDQIFNHPQEVYTQELLSAVPMI